MDKLSDETVERIKKVLRDEPELSQVAIAKRFNIHPSTVSRISRGKR